MSYIKILDKLANTYNHDGTIAWGELDDMEILADLLNKAHIVEQLMRS